MECIVAISNNSKAPITVASPITVANLTYGAMANQMGSPFGQKLKRFLEAAVLSYDKAQARRKTAQELHKHMLLRESEGASWYNENYWQQWGLALAKHSVGLGP